MKKLNLLVALSLAACFDTSYHLISPGDEHLELVGATPADSWKMPGFDDSAWKRTAASSADGAAAGSIVYERFSFDLGADVGSIKQLNLTLPDVAVFDAFINGEAMTGSGDARSIAPTSALRPAGNVLALAVTATAGETRVAPMLTASRGAAPSGPRLTRGPYLISPSASGATIVWETNVSTPSIAVVDGRAFDGGSSNRHAAVISGLSPSQSYAYHIEVGGQKSPDANLMTAPRPGEPVRFALFGDNRTNGDTHRRLVAALVTEAPDLIINTGDMVGESDDEEWRMFFDIEYPLLTSTPIVAAIGNHEVDYGDDDEFARVFPWKVTKYEGRVYSLDYGDSHFAMLDSNGDLHSQAHWLEEDLTSAEARGAKHEFVVMHWGPWCGVNKASHGNNGDAESAIVPVCKKHGVAAIFSGHNHVYERGADGNLAYVVAGGGGAPLDSPGHVRQTLVTKAVNSYVIVDVVAGQVKITAKDEASDPFDQAEWNVVHP